jgi:hypothetical protein
VIEQAKGILMAYRPQSPDQAFAELAHASQQHNVKAATLASALVQVASGASGLLPAGMRDVIETHWPAMLIDAMESPRTPMGSDGLLA